MCVSTVMISTRVGGGFLASLVSRSECGIQESHTWQHLNLILSLNSYSRKAATFLVSFYRSLVRLSQFIQTHENKATGVTAELCL